MPAASKRCVICADDYGHSRPTDATIAALIESDVINATTCLVESPNWLVDAAALREIAGRRPHVSLGLHLNLTERISGEGEVISPARLALDRSARFTDKIYQRFVAQWDRFVSAMGVAPHFIDGHQHVHLAPAARAALFRLIEQTDFQGWVRQCRTTSSRKTPKRLVLDVMSDGLRTRASKLGIQYNPGFGGVRRFKLDEDVIAQWIEDLKAMKHGGVLMVHPGADTPGDAIGACRRQEAEALPWVTDMLGAHGFSLRVDAQTPW